MARRKSKSKPRSRSKPKLNLLDVGVSLIIANSVSTNVTGLGLRNFLFAGTAFSGTDERGKNTLITGSNWNDNVTLMELFGGQQIGNSQSRTETPGQQLMANAKKNAIPLVVTVVGIPVAVKFGKRFLQKPILTPMNKVLKMSGLGVKV
jgi:hypothetical protein